VLSIFEAMKEDYVQPDEVAYLCVMRALVDSGAPEEVPKLYDELLKAKIVPEAKVELVRTEAYFKMVSWGWVPFVVEKF
jgi:pentatricopeptide repeat protein